MASRNFSMSDTVCSIDTYPIELYLLACQYDLRTLEDKCESAAIRMHNIKKPMEHVDAIGFKRVEDLVNWVQCRSRSSSSRLLVSTKQHERRLEQLLRNLPIPFEVRHLRSRSKRCRCSRPSQHYELGFLVMQAHSKLLEAELRESSMSEKASRQTLRTRRYAMNDFFAFVKRRLEYARDCKVAAWLLRSKVVAMEKRL